MNRIFKNTLISIFTALMCANISQAKDAEKPCWSLGDQLYRALKSGDVVDYSACWMSSRDLLSFYMEFSKKGPIAIADAEEFTLKRNKHVLYSFHFLSEELAKHGKLSKLELIDVQVEGEEIEADVVRTIDLIHVLVKSGDATFKIVIDDAYEVHGSWIFFDPPRYVIMPDGQKKTLMFKPAG